MGEINLRIALLDEPPQRDDDPADTVPALPDGPAITKLGDLWLLGSHRVLCGSALDAATFAELIGENRAAMVFTDRHVVRGIIARSRWPRARWTAT